MIRGDRVLTIGRAGMDLYADPPGTPIAGAARFEAALGGSPANIAAALARQGARPAMLARVSDDAVGRFVLARLDAHGIDRTHVRPVAGRTRTTLAVVDTRGDDTEAVLYRDDPSDLALTVEDAEAPDYGALDAVVATGTALSAEPSRGAVLAALRAARAAGATVVLDLDHRARTWPSSEEARSVLGDAARLSDVVVGNDEEFDVLGAGRGLGTARALAAEGRCVIHKMGAAGAILLHEGRERRFPPFRVSALKPTGAGDAFLGGLVAALGEGRPIEEAMRRGAAAAAIVVTRVGCAPASPSAAEVDAFLARHPEPGEADAHPAA